MVKYFYVLWWLSTLMELGLAGFWIELTNMRKYKHEIFRWNYVNLITCIHSNPMFFWYCSLISDIQIATCSRNSKNQPWNIMKILKYFPANGLPDWTKSGPERIQNRVKSWDQQVPTGPWIPGSLLTVRRQTGFSRSDDSSIGNDVNEGLNLLF